MYNCLVYIFGPSYPALYVKAQDIFQLLANNLTCFTYFTIYYIYENKKIYINIIHLF